MRAHSLPPRLCAGYLEPHISCPKGLEKVDIQLCAFLGTNAWSRGVHVDLGSVGWSVPYVREAPVVERRASDRDRLGWSQVSMLQNPQEADSTFKPSSSSCSEVKFIKVR